MEFFAGTIDERALLNRAHGAWAAANAHYTIAMMSLAKGDRHGAYEHFRLATKTNVIGAFDYEWSSAYLQRMDANPNWPTWLENADAE